MGTVSDDTPATLQGMTEELGRYIAGLAAAELAAGRARHAREILEGLAVANPYDPAPWAMLALLHRRRDCGAARAGGCAGG